MIETARKAASMYEKIGRLSWAIKKLIDNQHMLQLEVILSQNLLKEFHLLNLNANAANVLIGV